MLKKKLSAYDRFMALTDKQKAAEVAILDRELLASENGLPGHPLNAKEKAQWKKIQRRLQRGRPKVGRGVKRVMVSFEAGLLDRAEIFLPVSII
jgi:hypothetical protein